MAHGCIVIRKLKYFLGRNGKNKAKTDLVPLVLNERVLQYLVVSNYVLWSGSIQAAFMWKKRAGKIFISLSSFSDQQNSISFRENSVDNNQITFFLINAICKTYSIMSKVLAYVIHTYHLVYALVSARLPPGSRGPEIGKTQGST